MSSLKYIHKFISPSGSVPARELVIDTKLLNKHFSEIGMDYEKDMGYCIAQTLYEKIKSRLTKPHEQFLEKIERNTVFENEVAPRKYIFDSKYLDNVIAIAMYYHRFLYDLWSHQYARNTAKDIELFKNDCETIKKIITDVNADNFSLLPGDSYKINLKIKSHTLELESYVLVNAVLDFLARFVKPDQYKEQIDHDWMVSKLLELLKSPAPKFGGTGPGTNYETELTQKYVALLLSFLKKHRIIQHPKGKEKNIPDTMYYSCIADLFSLTTLPTMKLGNGDALVWDFESTEYNSAEQIKRIGIWIYNFGKKLQ